MIHYGDEELVELSDSKDDVNILLSQNNITSNHFILMENINYNL